jgi:hypothetical protein
MEFVRFVLVGAVDAGGKVGNVGTGVGSVAKRIRFVTGSCCSSLVRLVVDDEEQEDDEEEVEDDGPPSLRLVDD